MDQPPKQSKVFISPPPMGEQPWLDNGAGYKKVLEMSPPDTASKMLKLFTDVENIDWPVCTFTLEGTMFGETYYAGAAFSIYLEVEGQANKVKINQKAIGELQQNFLNAISAAEGGIFGGSGGTITNWPSVNQYIFPKYILQHGPFVLHQRLSARFISDDLRAAVQGGLMKWLQDKKVNPDLQTVGIWIRSKGGADAINDLTQAQYQHILWVLAAHKPNIDQIVVLGDTPSDSLTDIVNKPGKLKSRFKVVDLSNFRDDKKFKEFAGQATGMGGSIACQLLVCDLLRTQFNMRCLIGKRSGGMDGPTMVGVPQIFFENADSSSRMGFTSFIDPYWNQVLVGDKPAPRKPTTINDTDAYFTPLEAQRFDEAITRVFKTFPQ